MKKIVAMVSGGGTNLQAIFDAIDRGEIDAEVTLVISSARKAYALERARARGIPTLALPMKAFATPEECQAARHRALVEAQPDLIVLAGYLGILGAETIRAFPGRILNIHPALIPSFCGKGMYGHHVHEAALKYGVKVSGATVHFVSEDIDAGPIVFQGSVPVEEGDTPDTLAARILPVEHTLLPEAVRLFCQDRIVIDGRRVKILPPEEAKA
ncbi:MAG: phosphoribosylglycinamide formyltransferase [Candidatus Fimadaptatus sp.]